ncbi:MAG: glycosyltransferase family 4 protein [Candidatus Hydrogenedentes bacterium]|nr:glycosyltransferase family 4 protein [Candidatus Hydrogenedentota bacterium]
MKTGIDAHVLGTRAGGNETYMRALVQALAAHAPDADIAVFLNPGHQEPGLPFPAFPLPTRSSYKRMLYVLPRLCRQVRLDLVHIQYTAPLRRPCPYVVSLHDLVAFHFPGTMPLADRCRLRALTPFTVRHAARIFVLTRAVQRDIQTRYGIPEDRFDLVQPPVDMAFRPAADPELLDRVRRKYRLPARFVLYVGLIQPRKNLVRLAQAFARLQRHGLDHALVITGKRAWLYQEAVDAIARLDLQDRLIFTDYVPREDLPAIYAAADAFAYVSLYEGFGIPVLEALACGTPTLASTDAALAEVAGGTAHHVDPRDVDAIEQGLIHVLTDGDFRERARREGPLRAARFTPERMAAAALDGYRRAVE